MSSSKKKKSNGLFLKIMIYFSSSRNIYKVVLAIAAATKRPSRLLTLSNILFQANRLHGSLHRSLQMMKESDDETKIVITKPLSFDGGSDGDYKIPNMTHRLLSLFKNVRPGSDLTCFQLPVQFNLPKSHLQCFGESVYCIGKDLLHKCNNGENSLERFIAVVAWSISTTRPAIFGVAPYNPTLGETHHVSKGSLNVLLEQVSHHPPVSALYASDEKENIEMIWCQHPMPKFNGIGIDVQVQGERQLKLLNHKEIYTMNSPKLSINILSMSTDWVGDVRISCCETGLEAELCYMSKSFLRNRGRHYIKGKIYDSSSKKTLFEVQGHWNSTVTIKDINKGREMIIYDAKEVLSILKSPVIKDTKSIWPSESIVIWRDVTRLILSKDWEKARDTKKLIVEEQRELAKKRNLKREFWVSNYFIASYSEEDGWKCLPRKISLPPAPIIVPF